MKILSHILSNETLEPNVDSHRLFIKHSFIFQIEDDWEYVDDFEDANIICVFPDMFPSPEFVDRYISKLGPDQYILILSLFHIDDHMDKGFYYDIRSKYTNYTNNVLVCHKNSFLKNDQEEWLIYYDCMFNRQKVYFTEYNKVGNIPDAVWTRFSTQETYNLPGSKVAYRYSKKYLSTNYIYGSMINSRMRFRLALYDYLRTHDLLKDGHCNVKERFYCNNPNEELKKEIDKGGGIWYPVANKYYEESFLSVYVETVTQSFHQTRCLTEKTYDPLIKGNFPYPFGYPKIIEEIRNYGFELPKEFNYNFDDERDNDVRFNKYTMHLKDILSLSLKDLHLIYKKNYWMIKHNRDIFFKRPYDNLYKKLSKRLNIG